MAQGAVAPEAKHFSVGTSSNSLKSKLEEKLFETALSTGWVFGGLVLTLAGESNIYQKLAENSNNAILAKDIVLTGFGLITMAYGVGMNYLISVKK